MSGKDEGSTVGPVGVAPESPLLWRRVHSQGGGRGGQAPF